MRSLFRQSMARSATRSARLSILTTALAFSLFFLGAGRASAAPTDARAKTNVSSSAATPAGGASTASAAPDAPVAPGTPEQPAAPGSKATISIDLGNGTGAKPSQSIVIIVMLTLLAVAPALLMMLTSFTRIVIVLSITRNALGLQSIPPNQVMVGLALFLTFFVMSPVLGEMNKSAVQPYLKGEITQGQAYDKASVPLRTFMLKQTRKPELAMFVAAAGDGRPEDTAHVKMGSLVPAFILSELKTAFIIGFIVFIPFLVIDLIVSSSLMSMGMMMLPPVLVSLPFKIMLFVLVDGWALIVKSLLTSFH